MDYRQQTRSPSPVFLPPSLCSPYLSIPSLGRLANLDLAAVSADLDGRRLGADDLGLENHGRKLDALDDALGRGGLGGGDGRAGDRLRQLAEEGKELQAEKSGVSEGWLEERTMK